MHNLYLAALEDDGDWNVDVFVINTGWRPVTFTLHTGSFHGDTEAHCKARHPNQTK